MDEYDLMISYSHKTKEVTWKIHDWFEKRGFKIWIDKNYLDTELAKEIRNGIDKSSVFIPCFSSEYEKSTWCKKELTYASENDKHIIPIIVENGYVLSNDIRFQITGLKYFTLEGDFDTAMNQVLKAVKKYTNKTGTLSPERKELNCGSTQAVQAEQYVESPYSSKSKRENKLFKKQSRIGGEESDEGFCDDSPTNDTGSEVKISELSLNDSSINIRGDPDGNENNEHKKKNVTNENTNQNMATTLPACASPTSTPAPAPPPWTCKFDFLSDDKKEQFLIKTRLPLKDFRYGRPALKKILDQDDRVLTIMDCFDFERDSRMLVLFADNGGGNVALSFLEYLKMFMPKLKIKGFRECLVKFGLSGAENILLKNNYNDDDDFNKISYIHIRELSFQFVSEITNYQSWKDIAEELEISSVDINNIGNTGKRPCVYSRTEKLFDLIAMQYPQVTIQHFLRILSDCQYRDAHDLVSEKIIEKL
ncbi:uncharacterized protein LOC100211260 isoform X2 [Hydra vulgaris]|uniref:Uncharacterized protein LOC100211260 isoform X2 n=1 Tax=Hydra vulgaris TaxID=6087 RepID=A0ABM4DF80_HYDVU